jgi:hypothetical protein
MHRTSTLPYYSFCLLTMCSNGIQKNMIIDVYYKHSSDSSLSLPLPPLPVLLFLIFLLCIFVSLNPQSPDHGHLATLHFHDMYSCRPKFVEKSF